MSDKESTFTPYDLITDDLVKEAVKNSIGPETEVLSWETKDFTKKGDNYSSLVTSILVKYEDNGQTCETSFVAKLNPLRPASTFTEILEAMYARETIVLLEIMNGMNSYLKKLDLPQIRVPKLCARSLEKGKEMFITEDLRVQGFKMHDRTKGLDFNHALLVVEELGRFHASSFLFEETLFPKSIPESFDYFEEPWMTDSSHPSYKLFAAMINTQSQSACNFLKNIPTYEKCFRWLNDRLDCTGKLFIDECVASKPFDILCHGDCWMNNMLFKYDEEGNPVDIRFVDLQCSRKMSPACEINYFFYSSLNGDMRHKYMNTLEKAYYSSFSKNLELSGKEPPFTFTEFEKEMKDKKLFGLLAAIFVLPAVLAEGEEIFSLDDFEDGNFDEFMNIQSSKFALIAQRKGPFKERFLSMFDEMDEYKIFDD